MTEATSPSVYRESDSRGGFVVAIIVLLLLLGLASFGLFQLWMGLDDAKKDLGLQDKRLTQLKSDLSETQKDVLGAQDIATPSDIEQTEGDTEEGNTTQPVADNYYNSYPSYKTTKLTQLYYLDPTGSLLPPADSTYDVGSATAQWLNIYGDNFFSTSLQSDTVNANTVTSVTDNSTTVNTTDVNASTVNATTGNLTTVNSTTVNATDVNASTVNAGTGNLTTVNSTTVNTTDVNATTVSTKDVVATGTITASLFIGELNGCVTTAGGSKYCDNADIAGTLNVLGAATLGSTLDVTGNTKLNSKLDVTGATILGSTLDVKDNAKLEKDLEVINNTILKGTLDVSGVVKTFSEVFLGNGNEDRVNIYGPISSNDGDPLLIEDDQGLTVKQRNFPNILFAVDSSGNGTIAGTFTIGGNTTAKNIYPAATDLYDLGSSLKRWNNVYAKNFYGDIKAGCLTSYAGSSYCDSMKVVGSSVMEGNVQLGNADTDNIDVQGTIKNTSTSNNGHVKIDDRLVVTKSIGNGGAGPTQIKDDQGFSVEAYNNNNPATVLFLVDPTTGSITENADVEITGDLDIDGTFVNMLNAQLTVKDLIVGGYADINVVKSDLVPDGGALFNLGSAVARWQALYAVNGDFSGNVTIGTLTVGSTDVLAKFAAIDTKDSTQDGLISGLDSRVTTAEGSISTLQTGVTSLQTSVTNLQNSKAVAGYVACAGSPNNVTPLTCTVTVGQKISGLTVTPVGSGKNMKLSITTYDLNAGTATVAIYGEAGGSPVTGIMWTAVLNLP